MRHKINPLVPSTFVKRHSERVLKEVSGQIADIACGSGRNLVPFVPANLPIYGYDIDLSRAKEFAHRFPLVDFSQQQADLMDPLFNLPARWFSLVIMVHFYQRDIFRKALISLKPKGFIIFESIENRGENYREMPEKGEIQDMLVDTFDIIELVVQDIKNTEKQKIKVFAQRK